MEIPESFVQVERQGRVIVVRADLRQAIENAFCEPEQIGEPFAVEGGRGAMMRFPVPGGWGVVRPYRRGGAMGRLVREHYLLDNRPLRELILTVQLSTVGLPVAEPLGVWWERRGPWFRGAIATRYVAGPDLRRYLVENPADAEECLKKAGRLIHAVHEHAVYHADLQLQNFLVTNAEIVMLDFDNARKFPFLPYRQRARNLLRLRRSLQKAGFPEDYFTALCAGYGPAEWPSWLDAAYRMKGRVSDRFSRGNNR